MYINKSLKGRSIISNLEIDESISINCDTSYELDSVYDIGSSSKRVKSIYAKNLLLDNVPIQDIIINSISTSQPLSYTHGNVSLNFDNTLTTLSNGNLSTSLTNGNGINYSSNVMSVNYDNNTIGLNSSGSLKTNLTNGNGINYSSNMISVKYDNNTIGLNSAGNLKTNLTVGNGINYSSNMLSLKYDNDSIILNSAGNIKTSDFYTRNLFNATLPMILETTGNITLKYSNIQFGMNLYDELISKLGVNINCGLTLNEINFKLGLAINNNQFYISNNSLCSTLSTNTQGIFLDYTTNRLNLLYNDKHFNFVGNSLSSTLTTNSNGCLSLNPDNVISLSFNTDMFKITNGNLVSTLTTNSSGCINLDPSNILSLSFDTNQFRITAGNLQSKLAATSGILLNSSSNVLSLAYNSSHFNFVNNSFSSTLTATSGIVLNSSNQMSLVYDSNQFSIVSNKLTSKLAIASGEPMSLINSELSLMIDSSTLQKSGGTLAIKSSVMSDISNLKSDMTTAKGNISTIQSDLTTVQSDVVALDADVVALDGTVAGISSDIGTIDATLAGVALSIASLTAANINEDITIGQHTTNWTNLYYSQAHSAYWTDFFVYNLGSNNISSQSLLITNNATINNLYSSVSTLGNFIINSAGNIYSNSTVSSINLSNISTTNLTVVNTTFTGSTISNLNLTNLVSTNNTLSNALITNGLKSIFNSNTIGNIYTTGGNVGIGNSSPTYLLSINTTSDVPAINPDACNNLIICEDFQNTTLRSGITLGNISYSQYTGSTTGYLQLTPAANHQAGYLYWNINPGNSFTATFDHFAGGGSGADETGFYFGGTTAPTFFSGYASVSNGYVIVFQDYTGGSGAGAYIFYNGTQLAFTPITTFANNVWHTSSITFMRNQIKVVYDGTLILNYLDTTSRTLNLANSVMGFNGYNNGLNQVRRIRNIRISKFSEGLWQYQNQTSGNIVFGSGLVGIATLSPLALLDVNGSFKAITATIPNMILTNISSSSITNSGLISTSNLQATTATIPNIYITGNITYTNSLGTNQTVSNIRTTNLLATNISTNSIKTDSFQINSYDLQVGQFEQVIRGNSGNSRAIVKYGTGNTTSSLLVINFANDFSAGTQVQSNVDITGTLSVSSSVTMSNLSLNNITVGNLNTNNITSNNGVFTNTSTTNLIGSYGLLASCTIPNFLSTNISSSSLVLNNTTQVTSPGLLLTNNNGGGILAGFDLHHSIWLRKSYAGSTDCTGIYEYGKLSFFTGGVIDSQTERMTITSIGNIGIGQTNPTYLLDVNGIIHGDKLQLGSSSTNGGGVLNLFYNNTDTEPWQILKSAGGSASLKFNQYGSGSFFSIDANSNISTGNINCSKITSPSTFQSGSTWYTTSGITVYFPIAFSSTPHVFITSNDNTTGRAPSYKVTSVSSTSFFTYANDGIAQLANGSAFSWFAFAT